MAGRLAQRVGAPSQGKQKCQIFFAIARPISRPHHSDTTWDTLAFVGEDTSCADHLVAGGPSCSFSHRAIPTAGNRKVPPRVPPKRSCGMDGSAFAHA